MRGNRPTPHRALTIPPEPSVATLCPFFLSSSIKETGTIVACTQNQVNLCQNPGIVYSLRRGPGNSDSVISGSLASPKPPGGGKPEERGDEENETQSRGHLQGSGGIGRGQRRQDAGRIVRTVSRPSHPGHRMEAAIAGAGRGRVWRDEPDVGHTGSQDPPREDRTTGAGE